MDYSNSQLIAINTGQAKIQDGNFKLIHIIELDKYQRLIDDVKSIFEEHITETQSLFPYLKHEILYIQNLLNNLRPTRVKRSFDSIGKAWKWIAGNPDHEDFEIIENKINNVLKNNNKQVIINQLYNDRINNITKMANEITNAIKKDNRFSDHLALDIQAKLNLIKEELVNIGYAIHWAKLGIVNSMLLSKSEIKLATDALDKDNLPYSTPEEALDFANIKIVTNNSCIFYIINIPITTKEIYDKLLIKPIKKNNIINEIDYNLILRNTKDIFGIIKDCKTINNLSICNKNNIVNISNSTCIPNLLKSLKGTCNKINNNHIPIIDEISEGILLLNQFDDIITINDNSYHINGTFLINFHNVTVFINGTTFISKEVSTFKVLPAILQPTPSETEYRHLLSLKAIKQIQINNINQIDLLQTQKTIYQSTSYGLIAMVILISIIIVMIKMRTKKREITIIQKNEAPKREENPIPQIPSSTGQNDSNPRIRFDFSQLTNEDIRI